MKYFLVLMLVAGGAIAGDSPQPESRYACYKDKLIVQIKVPKAGVYTIALPADACGPET